MQTFDIFEVMTTLMQFCFEYFVSLETVEHWSNMDLQGTRYGQ
jgi:hypothetical protein